MTVGIVIVSHSTSLATGVAEVAGQMTRLVVPLFAAGGTAEGEVGTSVERIMDALRSVDNPDGALVLFDLGSAILSTEMALEMLTDELQGPVMLSIAPILEGAVAAALEAAQGHPLPQVKQAAERVASAEQLRMLKPLEAGEPVATAQPSTEPLDTLVLTEEPALEQQLLVRNPLGVHARPAALLVQTAGRFQAQVHIQVRERSADATSIMEVLSLAVRQGESITVRARGDEAQAAIDALVELVEADFYEAAPPTQKRPEPAVKATVPSRGEPDIWPGLPASPGIALAPALLYTPALPVLKDIAPQPVATEQIPAEQKRLRDALETVATHLLQMADQDHEHIAQAELAVFKAQALMVRDPALIRTAQQHIAQNAVDAASALAVVGDEWAKSLEQLDDPLIAGRAIDVRDVIGQAVNILRPRQDTVSFDPASVHQPVIVFAEHFTPSDITRFPTAYLAGLCIVHGGTTDHVAILAQGLGIPALVGVDEKLLQAIHTGDRVGINAEQGLLYSKPTADIQQKIAASQRERQERQKKLLHNASQKKTPLTFNGRHIALLANIGHQNEAQTAWQSGAEGIGLVRTELLFAADVKYPNEVEQRQRYVSLFRAFPDHQSSPIVVRTLDVGADKPLPALQATPEANPALGLRGLRLHLAHPELLEQQMRACLLAAADTHTRLQVMLPMVTTLEELRMARELFERVQAEVRASHSTLPAQIPLGIMIEVPSAALLASEMASLADFFSIGLNDLTQYTLACDRTNPAVANLYLPMHPAVLRLVQNTVEAAHRAGRPVAVCGASAGIARYAALFVGLGVDELSMVPTALPEIRAALTIYRTKDLAALAMQACQRQSIDEIEQLFQTYLA